MKIDVTLRITPKMVNDAERNEKKALAGHLGTHFDVMNKEFPLEYTERKGIVFDVSKIKNRDIEIQDVDINMFEKDSFVMFYTGFIEEEEYGSQRYFKEHPQLSNELINQLIEAEVSLIGVDFAGIRRGKEHTPKDQYCADHNVFVIENMCNLKSIINANHVVMNTYPMSYQGITGLPCRIIADVK